MFLPGNAFQRIWRGIPPRKSSRTRVLLLGNAFQRPGQGVPPGTALEQDRSHQAILSRGFGQGVPRKGSRTRSLLPGSAFKKLWSEGPRREGVPWNPEESQNEGLEVQAKRKRARGKRPGALRVPWSFTPLFWLFLGLRGIPSSALLSGNWSKLTLVEVHRDKFQSPE